MKILIVLLLILPIHLFSSQQESSKNTQNIFNMDIVGKSLSEELFYGPNGDYIGSNFNPIDKDLNLQGVYQVTKP